LCSATWREAGMVRAVLRDDGRREREDASPTCER
jgi:hypothetical protein